MAASGAKYGIVTSHFYWVGAIPAMVFVGVFMMPFYYGSRARSVPEYLKLRFDEKTRGFNAITFAAMTVFSSGISMYALGTAAEPAARLELQRQRLGLGRHRARLHLPRRPHLRDLQRGAAVLPDRARLRAAGAPGAQRRRRLGGPDGAARARSPPSAASRPGAWTESWQHTGQRRRQPDGRRVVRHGDGPRASCCRSATGARTSWSCSARWPPTR